MKIGTIFLQILFLFMHYNNFGHFCKLCFTW